jgi:hypothetical protein
VRRLAPAALLAVLAAAAQATPAVAAPVSAAASFSPLVHGFADPVNATLSVGVPRGVDPATVRVTPRFAPYDGRLLRVERRGAAGGTTLLRFVYRLTCARTACLPRHAERSFELRPARVSWHAADGSARTGEVRWPPLTVASRLTRADLASPSFAAPLDAPGREFAVSPGPLGIGLLALGSALAAAGAGALGALLWRRSRRPEPVAPLQRALELVEQASRGDVLQRRRALYQLALVLEEARLEPESLAARKLAWAPATPDPEGMQMLSLVIRHQLQEAV